MNHLPRRPAWGSASAQRGCDATHALPRSCTMLRHRRGADLQVEGHGAVCWYRGRCQGVDELEVLGVDRGDGLGIAGIELQALQGAELSDQPLERVVAWRLAGGSFSHAPSISSALYRVGPVKY